MAVISLIIALWLIPNLENYTILPENPKSCKQCYVLQSLVLIEENWEDLLTTNMRKVAFCESGLNPLAVGDFGHSRGILQIHNIYWPDVSDECAYDPECAIRWAYTKPTRLWSCARILGIDSW